MGGNYEKSIYSQLMEVMERLDSVENELHSEKAGHKEDARQLNARIDSLTLEDQALREDNARLKSIINNDSSNTSCPPSPDQKGAKPASAYNGREKTGRKAGAQKGHKGTAFTKQDIEEKIRSGQCRHKIREIADTSSRKYVTKYAVDLETAAAITEARIYADKNGNYHIPEEYHSGVTYGENVKALAAALYSEGVMSDDRTAAFLNAAGDGLELPQGGVYGFCKKSAAKAAREAGRLEEGLPSREAVMTDAAAVAINGKQGYVRNSSIEQTVIYRAVKSKSIQALKKLNFIEKSTGTLVHDHETALCHFGSDHGECNVHIIRCLRKNTEETKNKWPEKMRKLLCEMNKARKSMAAQGKTEFEKETLRAYEENYLEITACGRTENKTARHKYAKKDEQTLLNRLEKYMHDHLLFLHNFKVPFDDNMSERDLRKVKNRRKMAGGFRKNSGHEMYCTILSVIETMKRRKMGLIENIRKIFLGTPAVF